MQRYVINKLSTNTFLSLLYERLQAVGTKASLPGTLYYFHSFGWDINFKTPAFCRSAAYKTCPTTWASFLFKGSFLVIHQSGIENGKWKVGK
jgi:hypothetical protein